MISPENAQGSGSKRRRPRPCWRAGAVGALRSPAAGRVPWTAAGSQILPSRCGLRRWVDFFGGKRNRQSGGRGRGHAPPPAPGAAGRGHGGRSRRVRGAAAGHEAAPPLAGSRCRPGGLGAVVPRSWQGGACPRMGCNGSGQKGSSARARGSDRGERHRRGDTAAHSPAPSGGC